MVIMIILPTKTKTVMKEIIVYTNGNQLFTLENYDRVSGICRPLNITIHSIVSETRARYLHSHGTIHYVSGIGDRRALVENKLRRNVNINNFKVN